MAPTWDLPSGVASPDAGGGGSAIPGKAGGPVTREEEASAPPGKGCS